MTPSIGSPTDTILVVDDEREVLSVADDMLRAFGYTVLSTIDPTEALRLARLHPEPIHLLLTDVVMPIMSGAALAEKFRVLRPDAQVLFMSAYNVETVQTYRVRLAPGQPFLHKPFSMPDLQKTVRSALGSRSAARWPRTNPR